MEHFEYTLSTFPQGLEIDNLLQLSLQYDIIKTYYTGIGLVMSPNLSKNAYENL